MTDEQIPGTLELTAAPAVDPLFERMAAMPLPDTASNPLVLLRDHAAHPWAFAVAKRFATMLWAGGMLPKSYVDDRDRDGACSAATVAIMHGAKVGLDPLAAVQGLAVVNGMPKLWGDALPAVVMPFGVKIQEDVPQEWNQEAVAVCTVTRPGHEPVTRRFTWQDAKRAGLVDKKGSWQTHPLRMLQMRARAFALRDSCPDLLAGFGVAEEALDQEPERFVPVQMDSPKVLPVEQRPTSIDVQAAKLRETSATSARRPTEAPAKAEVSGKSGSQEPPAGLQDSEEVDSSPAPAVEERSQLGGNLVGRLVEAGLPLAQAKRVMASGKAPDDAEIHPTKAQRPRKAKVGDVWLRERDATVHVLVLALDADLAEGETPWEQIDLSPPKPADEPLLDPKELDPDVPGPGHAEADQAEDEDDGRDERSWWHPDLPEGPWSDCHAAEEVSEDFGEEVVWIRRGGKHAGTAYAVASDDTWRPNGKAGEWARAYLARNWSDTEAALNEVVDDWQSCTLDALYDAVMGA